jgi:hypothetical protein
MTLIDRNVETFECEQRQQEARALVALFGRSVVDSCTWTAIFDATKVSSSSSARRNRA